MKILGIVVTVATLSSLLIGITAAPVSAAVGNVNWGAVSTPSGTGNVLVEGKTLSLLAASPDGKTIFGWESTTNALYKSTDGGVTFAARPAGTTGLPAVAAVAMVVSPKYGTGTDLMVVVATTTKVWLSIDGGNNFAEQGTADLAVQGEGGLVTSVDMGNFYADGIMNILVGVTAAAPGAKSNVLRYRLTTGGGSWIEVGDFTVAGLKNYSVYAVKFSPLHAADSEIMAVVDNTVTAALYSCFATPAVGGGTFGNPTTFGTTSAITSAFIAVGSDYQGLATNTLAIGVNGATLSGVYKVSGRTSASSPAAVAAALKAGTVTALAISGPIATGTVLAGFVGDNVVYRSTSFTSSTASFSASAKSPTGKSFASTISIVWAGANVVAATNALTDSAVSVSTDGAINFSQTSFIDVGPIGSIAALTLGGLTVADANNMFLLMNSVVPAYTATSVFRTMDGGATWARVLVASTASNVTIYGTIASIAVSPAYATDKTFFVSQGTTAATMLIFKTVDNGNSFTPIIATDKSAFIVAVDGTKIYYGAATAATFYKSTSFINAIFPAGTVSNVKTMAINPKDATKATIAVGMNDGSVYQSTDDGANFTFLGSTNPGGATENMFVAYGPDGSLYAVGDGTGLALGTTAQLKRWTGTSWLTLQAVGSTLIAATGATGLVVTADGTLYVSDEAADVAAPFAHGAWRSLNPSLGDATSIAATEFQMLNSGSFTGLPATATAASLSVGSSATDNTLYITDSAGKKVYGFKDTLIVAPKLTSPAAGALLTTQTSAALAWTAVTNATQYQVQVDTAANFSAPAYANAAVTGLTVNATGTISAGNTYNWRVRANSVQVATAPAVNLYSRWATVQTFITALPVPVVAAVNPVPAQGATGVDVNTTFSWAAVPGTGVTYEFVIAEELGNVDKFAIIDYSATAPTNATPLRETLKYNTQYWWRVRAVTATSKSDWLVGFFTTESAPVVTTAPSTTVAPPVTTIIVPTQTIPTPTVTVINSGNQNNTPVIPSALLWAIIAIGAVLIIAVIVLIVRTRKI
jgi:hypothetical protein